MPALQLHSHRPHIPPPRSRPTAQDGELVSFGVDDAAPTVFVRPEVLDTLVRETESAAPSETIGFLVGRVFQDGDTYWALVEAAYTCQKATRTRVSVETSHDDQAAFEAWMRSSGLAYDKLGWWHSHYELGVHHYSSVDRQNQALWCSRRWQLGLLVVVEKGVPRVRCYQGPNSDAMAPFVEVKAPAHPTVPARQASTSSVGPRKHIRATAPSLARRIVQFAMLTFAVACCVFAILIGRLLRAGWAACRAACCILLFDTCSQEAAQNDLPSSVAKLLRNNKKD